MSYNIDGKVANQSPRLGYTKDRALCSKCSKKIQLPDTATMIVSSSEKDTVHNLGSYIGTDHFIYESKSGKAVVYCSEYCRNKHNHRFNR